MSLLALFIAAIAFWGQGNLPACGQPQLSVADIDPNAGLAYKDRCLAVIDDQVADFYYGGSTLYRCTIIFHEVGHLYGMSHSERGVMSTTWGPTAIPPVCRRIAPMQLSRWRNGRVFATAM